VGEVEAGEGGWDVEQVEVREEAVEINQALVQPGIASVQSAVIRNHMSLVNVALTELAPNVGRR
jgi:hypothetical protein